MTQEELDAIILLEQAKKNPQYKNIREKLLESNRNDLLKNGDDNNALQNLELPIQNKIKNNKVVNKKDNNSGRIINDNEEFYEENSNENFGKTNEENNKIYTGYENGLEELDDSSFSLNQKQLEIIKNNNHAEYSEQNDTWQDHLEKNYKATGTRTTMKSLLPTAKALVTDSNPLKGDILYKHSDST